MGGHGHPGRYPSVDPELARASEPVPTDFLKDFYAEAYRRIRRQSDEVTVVFHDGFRPGDWGDYFISSGFERIVLDTHQYLMVHLALTGRDELEEYLRCIRDEWAPLVRELAAQVPLIIGEWCVDTTSPKPLELGRAERAAYFRQLGTPSWPPGRPPTAGSTGATSCWSQGPTATAGTSARRSMSAISPRTSPSDKGSHPEVRRGLLSCGGRPPTGTHQGQH